jgi:hypothetical protein
MRIARMLTSSLLVAACAAGCAPPDETSAPAATLETIKRPIVGNLDQVAGPGQVASYFDCKGRVLTAIWWCITTQTAEVHNAVCPLGDPSYVAVSGGAWALQGQNFPGAFIVDAFIPTGSRDSFQAASKSHVQSNPHLLAVLVVGLKVTGLSREQLLANIQDSAVTSQPSAQPAAGVFVPSGRILLGGSVSVQWNENATPGQLLVGSTGSVTAGLWTAASTQHILSDTLPLTTTATSMAPSIGGIDFEAFDFPADVSSSSGVGEARVSLPEGVVPTAIGADVMFNGSGRFLIRVGPDNDRYRDFVVQSKDHIQSDSGRTFLNVIGLREKITAPTRCVKASPF